MEYNNQVNTCLHAGIQEEEGGLFVQKAEQNLTQTAVNFYIRTNCRRMFESHYIAEIDGMKIL